MAKKMRHMKAGKAFKKAIAAVERACSGKKAAKKKCDKAMKMVAAAKRRLTKAIGSTL